MNPAFVLMLGVVLAVLVQYGSDALGLPRLTRGLLVGAIIGVTGVLAARQFRR